MSRAMITEAYLTDIADAIRAKLDVETEYTPPQMAAAIESIPTGGDVEVEALSVTQNGTYTAPTGKAYSPVTVDVSGGGGSELIVGVGVISASSQYESFEPIIAPGINTSNMWGAYGAGSAWWQIEFYTATTLKTVKFAPYAQIGSAVFWSATVALKGSNDLTTWDDLLSLSDLPQSNDQLTYTLNSTAAYKYYRFVCQSGSSYYTGLGKIQMYT